VSCSGDWWSWCSQSGGDGLVFAYEMALAQEDSTRSVLDWTRFSGSPKASMMFAASIKSVIGDGASTLFWTDVWIQGKSIVDLAPYLGVPVSRRLLKHRTVQEALRSGSWVHDVRNNLSNRALFQLICI
jgi:hypothetical protein